MYCVSFCECAFDTTSFPGSSTEDLGKQQAITAADWFTHDSLISHSYANFDWIKFNKPIWRDVGEFFVLSKYCLNNVTS